MNGWKISTLVFAGLFALSLGYSAANAEKQPHMVKALVSLKAAKNQLEAATPDKGGHRVKALALTTEAIEQVEKGIAYDDKH